MTWRDYLKNMESAYKSPDNPKVIYLAWWRLVRPGRKLPKQR